MSNKKIYRARTPVKTFFKILAVILILFVTFSVLIFFSFQKYIVYAQDGIRLEIPFLSSLYENGEDAPETAPVEVIVSTPYPNAATSDIQNAVQPEAQDGDILTGVFVPAAPLSSSLAKYTDALTDLGGTALVIELKPSAGQLAYKSDVEQTISFDTGSNLDLKPVVSGLKDQGIYLVAQVSCFADTLMASRNTPTAITDENGNIWSDSAGVEWLQPGNEDVQTYIKGLCAEIFDMGFDEILLTNFAYPDTGAEIGDEDRLAVLSAFAKSLAAENPQISVLVDERALAGGEPSKSGQDLDELAEVFFRFFAYETAENAEALALQAEGQFGSYVNSRFVSIVPYIKESAGSWIYTGT